MYKNQLQELAQRSCLNLPSYSCVREGPDHAPKFKATVNFNGETFESPTFCSTLRLAEHAAAEVALNTLANRGPSKTLAARVLDETGIYKNLLQETAHRAGLKLPLYTTIRSGPGHVPVFSCTVELAGMSFSGEPARTKKQAQKNSAIAAWAALKQLAQSRTLPSTCSSSVPQIESTAEPDQVIIARILASLQVSEPNKSIHIDPQRSISMNISQDPSLPLPPPPHSRQHETWVGANFPTEIAMHQLWQHQAHFLQLQPRIYPFQFPLNQPNNVPMRPVVAIPPSYMPRGFVPPVPIQSSIVEIQEIEEKTESLSNLSSRGETPVIIQEQSQNRQPKLPSDPKRVNLSRPQLPLMLSSGLSERSLHQNLQNRAPAPLQMRSGASSANLVGTRAFGKATSRFMAPAVQIRSVAPVCSAPHNNTVRRKTQDSSQVGQSSDQQVERIGRDDGDLSELSSGVGKLEI